MNWKNPTHLLAFGFGSGLSPRAPGTAGTLAAVPIYCLMAYTLSPAEYGVVLVLSFALGVYICGRAAQDLRVHDHPGIVWDEFVGFWLTMWWVPLQWYWLLLGLVLFRFFDVVKPWPIALVDKDLGGGLGIMVDDVLAAVYAGALLHLCVYFSRV